MACGAPTSASTGELLAPATSRLAPVLEKTIRTAEALQGFLTLQRRLTQEGLSQLEGILKECVARANVDVNESYQKQAGGFAFENGRFPSDAECSKVVRRDAVGDPVTLAQELGRLKHTAAFDCISARLPEHLRDNFTQEPRYKPDPEVNGVELAAGGAKTLHPDFVVHGTRNAVDVQCVYEFKFPCFANHKLDPLMAPGVQAQLRGYQKLTRRCPAALVSPKGLDSFLE